MPFVWLLRYTLNRFVPSEYEIFSVLLFSFGCCSFLAFFALVVRRSLNTFSVHCSARSASAFSPVEFVFERRFSSSLVFVRLFFLSPRRKLLILYFLFLFFFFFLRKIQFAFTRISLIVCDCGAGPFEHTIPTTNLDWACVYYWLSAYSAATYSTRYFASIFHSPYGPYINNNTTTTTTQRGRRQRHKNTSICVLQSFCDRRVRVWICSGRHSGTAAMTRTFRAFHRHRRRIAFYTFAPYNVETVQQPPQ